MPGDHNDDPAATASRLARMAMHNKSEASTPSQSAQLTVLSAWMKDPLNRRYIDYVGKVTSVDYLRQLGVTQRTLKEFREIERASQEAYQRGAAGTIVKPEFGPRHIAARPHPEKGIAPMTLESAALPLDRARQVSADPGDMMPCSDFPSYLYPFSDQLAPPPTLPLDWSGGPSSDTAFTGNRWQTSFDGGEWGTVACQYSGEEGAHATAACPSQWSAASSAYLAPPASTRRHIARSVSPRPRPGHAGGHRGPRGISKGTQARSSSATRQQQLKHAFPSGPGRYSYQDSRYVSGEPTADQLEQQFRNMAWNSSLDSSAAADPCQPRQSMTSGAYGYQDFPSDSVRQQVNSAHATPYTALQPSHTLAAPHYNYRADLQDTDPYLSFDGAGLAALESDDTEYPPGDIDWTHGDLPLTMQANTHPGSMDTEPFMLNNPYLQPPPRGETGFQSYPE